MNCCVSFAKLSQYEPSFGTTSSITIFNLCKTCEYPFVLSQFVYWLTGEEDIEPVELVSVDLGDTDE